MPALAAVPLCVVCSVLALNSWFGYFPTVHAAWNQLTVSTPPDEITMTAMQLTGVPVSIEVHRVPLPGLTPALPAVPGVSKAPRTVITAANNCCRRSQRAYPEYGFGLASGR